MREKNTEYLIIFHGHFVICIQGRAWYLIVTAPKLMPWSFCDMPIVTVK